MSLVEAVIERGRRDHRRRGDPARRLPILDLGQNLKLALVFTGVSIMRSYGLRRLFERFRA